MPATTTTEDYRPAYLGDAEIGDRIRFRLPADTAGAFTTHEGTVWAYDRDQHAVGFPVVAFRISGDCARLFTCRPDLHIEIARAEPEVELVEPITDTGGYLPCGCHGSQSDHTCGPLH